jgi:Leucine-rich repeat (LRR) protein
MKRLTLNEADNLNYFAACVELKDINEQNFLYWYPEYKDIQMLKLSVASTPKSLLALTVFNGTTLHTLDMSDNRIIKCRKKLNDGNMKLDIDILCKAFIRLPNLTSLDVSDSEFGEYAPLLILSMSRSLKILNLSKNEIGEHGSATTNALKCLINLTHLDLSDNNLTGPTLKILQTYPQAFPKLKSLDIRKNFDIKDMEFLNTLKVIEDHNEAVSEPLFKSFCEFLIIHPEVDPSVTSDIVGDHHDHTITLYHD